MGEATRENVFSAGMKLIQFVSSLCFSCFVGARP